MCRSRARPVIDENELSMAGNSRYTDERKDCYRKEDGSKIHVGGGHGWNFCKGTGLLFLVAFSLLCGTSQADSNPCILTKEGTHDCPFTKEQALLVEYGQPITMFCYREWSSEKRPFSRDRQVSDFIILLNNEIVHPLTDFGQDEVRLYLNTLPPSTNTFECRLKISNDTRGDTELIFRSTISIRFKPTEPRSFRCVSHKREKVVCTWDPEPNAIPTRFSLRVSTPDWSALLCPASQVGSKIPPNSCVWDTSTDPPYNPAKEYYTFLLDGENTLGKNSFAYKFHRWEDLIPSQPDDLLVLNITDSSAMLRWSVPRPMQAAQRFNSLHHRVSYRAQSDSRKTWRTIATSIDGYASEFFFHLTDLEWADTVYNFRVSMKFAAAKGEDMWSEPAETIFKTAVSRKFSYTVKYHWQERFAIDAFRPPEPKTVDVDRIGSDSVEVRWELPYSGRIRIVKGYHIYYCPALSSQNCTGPTMKTFVKGDHYLTVGTVRDLRPDTTYKLTIALLSENGEGLHSAPSYFTTTKAAPDRSSIEKTIRVAIEQSSSGIKDYVKDLMKQYKQNEIDELRSQITALNAKLDSHTESTKQCDEALGDKLNGIDELNARINDSVTEVSNLGQTISAYKVELVSLSEENCQLRENVTQCGRDLADCFGRTMIS